MTDIPKLSGPEHPPASGGTPKQLVILLHGVGADGEDLIGLAPELADSLPDAHFISPNSPFPCDMAPYGYQWFSLLDRSLEKMLAGVQTAAPILNHFIDTQLDRLSLDDSKLAIVGFSQGTMTGLFTCLRRPAACAAIVGFSGALIGENIIREEITAKPPVCLIHGDADPVVPFAAMAHAESVLAECGVKVEAHPRPGLGHGIDPEGLDIARIFLHKYVN